MHEGDHHPSRPEAVIHVTLTSPGEVDIDADARDALADVFATLVEAAALASAIWPNLLRAGPGKVRLLHDAETPLPAIILDLAAAHGVGVRGVVEIGGDLVEGCDCSIVAGVDDPHAHLSAQMHAALALGRGVILLGAEGGRPHLLTPLHDEFGLDGLNHVPTASHVLSARTAAIHLLGPPASRREQVHLAQFLAEGAPKHMSRIEYDLLMRVVGPARRRGSATADVLPEAWQSAKAIAGPRSDWLDELRRVYDIVDAHALYFGEKWRSGIVTRSLILLVSTVMLGFIGMLNANLSLVTLPLQALFAGLAFLDRRLAARGQWQRRWLEYRMLAERLRCLRFLHLAGAADAEDARGAPSSWPSWYSTRFARMLGPGPASEEQGAELVFKHLLDVEIGEQIAYHREAFRRFTAIDRRARRLSRFLLALTTCAGIAITILYFRYPGEISWTGIASLALSGIPAIANGLAGLRAEFDLMRLVERSLRIRRGLMRLTRAATEEHGKGALITLDRNLARRAASLMLDEVSQWRSVSETRVARLKRH